MKKIYKYTLEITDEQTIEMPVEAQVLKHAETVSIAHGSYGRRTAIWIWALVDLPRDEAQAVTEGRRFLVVGTGNPLPELIGEHVATVRDGGFVWHVFDVGGAM